MVYVRIHTFKYEPWTRTSKINGAQVFSGSFPYLVARLASALNFSYSLLNGTSIAVGNDHNGQWTGLFGMLQRNETDALLSPFIVNSKRSEVFKFTAEISYSVPVILSGRPTTYKTFKSAFSLLILTPNAIIGLAVLMACMTVLTYWSEYIDLCQHPKSYRRRKIKKFFSLGYFFWIYFSSIFTQCSTANSLQASSSRLANAIWWLSLLVLFGMYNSNMQSSFTVFNNNNIDNLKALLKNPNVRPLIQADSPYADYFKSALDPNVIAVWQQCQRLNGELPKDEFESPSSILEVANGHSVLIAGEDDIVRILEQNCEPKFRDTFVWAPGVPFLELSAFPISRRFPDDFYERMNRILRYYAATMQSYHDMESSRLSSHICVVQKPTETYHPFSVNDFYTVFTLWIVGMSCATVQIVIELVFYSSPCTRRCGQCE